MTSPITPPPELVCQWCLEAEDDHQPTVAYGLVGQIATKAARWGADQELEECCEQLKSIPSPLGIPFGEMASNALRASRRPKPPRLKEQALARCNDYIDPDGITSRALEALDDD
jgi:hypothetical protein